MGLCLSILSSATNPTPVVAVATSLLSKPYVADDDLRRFNAVLQAAETLSTYEICLFIRVQKHADQTRGEDTVARCLKAYRVPQDRAPLLEQKTE